MKEQCFFVGVSRHLSDASLYHFSSAFAITLVQLCIRSRPLITMTLTLKHVITSPAVIKEGSPSHNAPSKKVLTHAYVHLKLWIFLNLALRAPRRQEAYFLLLG